MSKCVIDFSWHEEYTISFSLKDNQFLFFTFRCTSIVHNAENYLNSTTKNSLALGLSLTDQWRRGFEIIETNLHRYPHETRIGTSAVIQRAFKEGERNKGLELLRQFYRRTPHFMIDPDIFQSYFKYCQQNLQDVVQNIEVMLRLIQDECIPLSRRTVSELNETLSLVNKELLYTNIDSRYF